MTIQSTKTLIASGQTEAALKQLLTLTSKADKDTQQTAILLSASWEYQQREATRGTLSFEDANLQRNRIARGTLELLADLENQGAVAPTTQSGLQQDLWNNPTAALMQNYANNQTSVNARGEANVIVGQGNTINQRKVTGFGWRQFLTILLTLTTLGGGGYWAYKNLFKSQDKTYASVSDIQSDLMALVSVNSELKAAFDKNRLLIESQLTKGVNALDAQDYPRAVQYLEKVAEQTPASSVYQNIAFAYDKMGNQAKANEARAKANGIKPTATAVTNTSPQKVVAQSNGQVINLIAPENGGKVVATSSPEHKNWTDGDVNNYGWSGGNGWAIYGFDSKIKASEFRIWIPSSYIRGSTDITISYSNDSPTGTFTVIDTFKPFNGLLTDFPYQKFSLPPISAKYIKIETSILVYELQLMGTKE